MRILFLSVSGELGGAERALVDLLGSLRGLEPRWTLGVLAFADGPLSGELRALGVEVQVTPMPAAFAALGERGHSPAATLAGLATGLVPIRRYAGDVRRHLAAWQPDVVHANGLKAHIVSAWVTPAACALVWHVHDYVSTRRISSLLVRRYARRPSAIVANSHSVAADVQSLVNGGRSVVTIHNGVDLQRFRSEGRRLDLDRHAGLEPAAAGMTRVGLVATYAKWKGHEVFLRALARLPADLPFRGYVVGGPVYQTRGSQHSAEALRHEILALGLEGRVGLVPFQADTAPVYRALDVAVHASTSPEPFGLAIVEAMACGRAVVVSDAGGATEVVRQGVTGLVHAPGDPGELAARIERLCRDASLRERLGRSAIEDVRQRFDRRRVGVEAAALYRRICGTAALAGA